MLRRLAFIIIPCVFLLGSCQKESQVDKATRDGILLVGNSNEPKEDLRNRVLKMIGLLRR